jgi:hypothetical protein
MGKQRSASSKRCESKKELKIKKSKRRSEVEPAVLPPMEQAHVAESGDHGQQIRKSEKTQAPTEGCPQVKPKISKKSKDIAKPSKVKGGSASKTKTHRHLSGVTRSPSVTRS